MKISLKTALFLVICLAASYTVDAMEKNIRNSLIGFVSKFRTSQIDIENTPLHKDEEVDLPKIGKDEGIDEKKSELSDSDVLRLTRIFEEKELEELHELLVKSPNNIPPKTKDKVVYYENIPLTNPDFTLSSTQLHHESSQIYCVTNKTSQKMFLYVFDKENQLILTQEILSPFTSIKIHVNKKQDSPVCYRLLDASLIHSNINEQEKFRILEENNLQHSNLEIKYNARGELVVFNF